MILKNAFIITQNAKRENISRGYIRIRGPKITEIGRSTVEKKEAEGTEKVINLKGRIIMPGLINAHCHLGDLVYGSIGDDLKSPADILNITNQIDCKIGKRKINQAKNRARLKTVGFLLKNGVTALAGGRGIKEAQKFGVKFFGGIILKGREDINLEVKKMIGGCRENPLCYPGVFIHSLLETSLNKLFIISKWLKKKNLTVMIHLGEFPEEKDQIIKVYGKERIDVLKESGLLAKNQKMIIIHGNFLEEEELKELSKYKVAIILCPASARKFKYKTIDLNLLNKYGISKALATDGPITNPDLDLFTDARNFYNLKKDSGEELSIQELLDMITIGAAEILGIQKKVGSLDVGKFADILILEAKEFSKIIEIGDHKIIKSIILNGRWFSNEPIYQELKEKMKNL